MKFLFNAWARAGHLNPCIGIAQRLLELRQEVVFFCFDDASSVQAQLRRAGAKVDCLGPPETVELARSRVPVFSKLELSQKLRNPRWRLKYLDQLLVHRAKVQIPEIQKIIRETRPDVLCNEALSYGGAIAAELEQTPWATITATWDCNASPNNYQCDMTAAICGIDSARRLLATSFGTQLDFRFNCVVSPFLNIAFSIPELTFEPVSLPDRSYLVGPLPEFVRGDQIAFPWDWLDPSRPLVYISDGTELKFPTKLTDELARASVASGAQVVITDGALSTEKAFDADQILRVKYAPQLQLFARTALFLTHGGSNSLMGAIANGVPSLVLPIAYDQQFNAVCAKRAGIARVQDPWSVDYQSCARDIQDLLKPDAIERKRAKDLQERIKGRDGSQSAALLLCELAKQGDPRKWT